MGFRLDANYDYKPNRRYYGIGNNTPEANLSYFLLTTTTADASLLFGVSARRQVRLVGGYSSMSPGNGHHGSPLLQNVFDLSSVPYATQTTQELWYGLTSDFSRLDNSREPSHGFDGSLDLRRAVGMRSSDPDYYQWRAEVRAYVPLFARRRVIALRSVYSGVAPVSGTATIMPFYRLPESRGLSHFAGYSTDRYRDQQLMLARIEYRWALSSTRWTSSLCTSWARSRRTQDPSPSARRTFPLAVACVPASATRRHFGSNSRPAMKGFTPTSAWGLSSDARDPRFVPERGCPSNILASSAPMVARGKTSIEAIPAAGAARTDPAYAAAIHDSTWVDHDRHPIEQPSDWEPNYWGRRFHQGFIDPISHLFDIPDKLLWGARAFGARTEREAVNVNAFDEAPNSTWFTNRNNALAVPVAELRQGPDSVFLPTKPWTIKHASRTGGRQDSKSRTRTGRSGS